MRSIDLKRDRLSELQKEALIECFAEKCTAAATAIEMGLNRNTISRYYKRIRERISAYQLYELMSLELKNIDATTIDEGGLALIVDSTTNNLFVWKPVTTYIDSSNINDFRMWADASQKIINAKNDVVAFFDKASLDYIRTITPLLSKLAEGRVKRLNSKFRAKLDYLNQEIKHYFGGNNQRLLHLHEACFRVNHPQDFTVVLKKLLFSPPTFDYQEIAMDDLIKVYNKMPQ